MLAQIKNCTEVIHIKLRGCEDWDLSKPRSWCESYDGCVKPANDWSSNLNAYICQQLWFTITECKKQKTLRLQGFAEHNPFRPSLSGRDYLTEPRLFLPGGPAANTLTALELDIRGTGFLLCESHFCPIIGKLLSTVQRLKLRLQEICSDVLNPQVDTKLRLNEVLINLSLLHEGPNYKESPNYLEYSKCCYVYDQTASDQERYETFLQLKQDMQAQARVLVGQMENPKIVRILDHGPEESSREVDEGWKMRSLDVLTGRLMELEGDMDWEDDGRILQVDEEKEAKEGDE